MTFFSGFKLFLVISFGLFLFFGCSFGLGDFCYRDSDCKEGLQCTAQGDQRGICTYPEGIPDQSISIDLWRDISKDTKAAKDCERHGCRGVPVILIGSRWICGFNEPVIKKELEIK